MPTAAPSRCTRRCGRLAVKDGRCAEHEIKPWSVPSANSRALTSTERGRINRQQIKREPQCRGCGSTKDLHADHIVEIADGGSLFDASNLQTLCGDCHDEKSAFVRAERAAERRLARG